MLACAPSCAFSLEFKMKDAGKAEAMFPQVKWQRSARWTVDGNVYASSGISAGTDMALGFIADVFGRECAENAARYAEYTWNDDPGNDPFAR